MPDEEELRIEFTDEELRRLEETAEHSGLDAAEWARRALLRMLEARETREDDRPR